MEDIGRWILFICCKVNGKRTTRRVHRLVLHTFNPVKNEDTLEVHHIDENIENNRLENLKWVTHEENIHYIAPEKLKSPTQFIARPVAQFTLAGIFINSYPSAYQAAKILGLNHRHISEVCNGRRRTHGGFIWHFLEGSTTSSNECKPKQAERETI